MKILRHRCAFTLIEVLLTTVLAATLLAALWSLLSMHLRIFDSSQTKSEVSQLARTLLDQIHDDLHAALRAPAPLPGAPIFPTAAPTVPASSTSPAGASSPAGALAATGAAPAAIKPATATAPTPAGAPGTPSATAPPAALVPPGGTPGATSSASVSSSAAPSGLAARLGLGRGRNRGAGNVTVSSSLRPAGLFGTETSLQIDLAQTAVPRDEAELEQRPAVGTVGPSRAAELRTVIYSFQETEEPGMPRGESKLQFTRREMDWEDAHPPLQGAAGGGRRAGGTPRFGAPRGEAGGEDAPVELEKRATEDQPLDDETSITVPEVRDFALRYFDGSAWSTEWDSAARGGLPVAVEVSFDLREVRDAEPAQHAPVADSAVETRSEKPLPPTHRLVIYLPQGGVTRTPVDSAFPMRHPAGRTSADPGSRGNGR